MHKLPSLAQANTTYQYYLRTPYPPPLFLADPTIQTIHSHLPPTSQDFFFSTAANLKV